MAVNIYEISEAAGVSIATVSRVLNNSPKVSPKTREKVLSVIAETGYTPNAFAQGLGLRTMKTVGILCADSSDTFFSSVIYHIEENLRRNGYNCILCCSGHDKEKKKECLSYLLSKSVDAIIILGSTYMENSPKEIDYLFQAAENTPLFGINCHFTHPNIYCVENDPYRSVYELTRQILRRGKQHPLFIYSRNDFYGIEKQRGFVTAVQERLLVPEVLRCPEKVGDATAFLLENQPADHDIVITAHDELAVAFLKYAKRVGIRVPEDCNVVGHGDLLLAECCEPELTTLNLHVPQLCETVVSLMIQVLQGEMPSHFITVAADVRERASTDVDLFA